MKNYIFIYHVTCRLTAKNRDQLRNPTIGNRVWATFTFYRVVQKATVAICWITLVKVNQMMNPEKILHQKNYIFISHVCEM